MADFRDHIADIHDAGFDVVGISADAPTATALLQAELFIPFDLLSDEDRRVMTEWDLLNADEKGGIAVPAVFAIGRGRTVLARSLDTMTRQIGPKAFLDMVDAPGVMTPRRRFVLPRVLEFLRVSRRVSRSDRGE